MKGAWLTQDHMISFINMCQRWHKVDLMNLRILTRYNRKEDYFISHILYNFLGITIKFSHLKEVSISTSGIVALLVSLTFQGWLHFSAMWGIWKGKAFSFYKLFRKEVPTGSEWQYKKKDAVESKNAPEKYNFLTLEGTPQCQRSHTISLKMCDFQKFTTYTNAEAGQK